jgi:HNH endonuclease
VPRGVLAKDGRETVSANGYTYVRVGGRWRPKSHLVAERALGRSLREGETVRFKDGDKTNFDPDNLMVTNGPARSTEAKIVKLISKRNDITDLLVELINELPEHKRQEYLELANV